MNNKRKKFSIIEMLTVVLIILLLISLMIPIFLNLKMKARTAICAGNLRQIGILLTSYQSDYGMYLPNDNANGAYGEAFGDIPAPAIGNNNLYTGWQGHLLPYFDVNLPDKYTRIATFTKVGTTRFESAQFGGLPNSAPDDVLKNGWVVVDDAIKVGGYQDLKAFICPEIHQNTFDIAVSNAYNGLRVPRIGQLVKGNAFPDKKGFTYGMAGGVPTTYLANSVFFGEGDGNSMRIDQIGNVSRKALIIEGGLVDDYVADANGWDGTVYYKSVGSYNTDGGHLTSSNLIKNKPEFHKLSFVHDGYDTFWIMGSSPNLFPSKHMSLENKSELAIKFNNYFAGKAWMIAGSSTTSGAKPLSYTIVSTVYPGDDREYFKEFFIANPPGVELNLFEAYIDDPNEFSYLTGDMNVLFGDGAVLKKEQAWLCNNRKEISLQTAD
jgi:type II secretory pathway pseudopilin PulG